MLADLRQKCQALLTELDLSSVAGEIKIQPLTGGVASDIAMIDLGERKICAKFALERLKVAEDWRAPVHRNRAEYEWLKLAARIAPETSVQLLGHSAALNGFAMTYIEGDDVALWKTELLAERASLEQAVRVGDVLGRIHCASTKPGFDSGPFQNRDDFHALRIEPYLTFTARRHPQVARTFTMLADALYGQSQVLVHGDVSPKNILFRGETPVLLDAECATIGDASFDVGFCVNHLILKAIHLTASRDTMLAMARALWEAYASYIDWEAEAELNARVSCLIPALMLARVDGKSPIEYLSVSEQETLRALALALMGDAPKTVQALTEQISTELQRRAK